MEWQATGWESYLRQGLATQQITGQTELFFELMFALITNPSVTYPESDFEDFSLRNIVRDQNTEAAMFVQRISRPFRINQDSLPRINRYENSRVEERARRYSGDFYRAIHHRVRTIPTAITLPWFQQCIDVHTGVLGEMK